jgi:YD repeat-containing protein
VDLPCAKQTPQGELTYTYDAANRLSSRTIVNQTPITYSYDAADRLTGMSQGALSASFSYDNAGRQTQLTMPNGVVQAFTYDPNSRSSGLTWNGPQGAIGTLGYAYDADGRIIQKTGTFALTSLPTPVSGTSYNANNQQTNFNGPVLTYDANGNLTGDNGNTYTWDARNHLTAISGAATASFVYDACVVTPLTVLLTRRPKACESGHQRWNHAIPVRQRW